MLNIIYGTENSNRKEYVDNLISKNKKSGNLSWLLVPEQFSLSTERDVIKNYGIKAQDSVKVITFSRLCNLVFSKLGPLRMKYIDGAGKQIIAAETIRSLQGKLNTLARTIRRKGFASDIVSLVSEFKRYGINPELLASTANEVESDDLSLKLNDISKIYEVYDNLLNSSSADAEDNLTLVIPKLKECAFLKGSLFIRHFRSFTPVELNAIAELMQLLDVYVDLCCDDIYKSSDLFSSSAETGRKLIETAKTHNVPYSAPVKIADNPMESEIDILVGNYFSSYPKPQISTPHNVKIFEVSNNYREAEAAADLILRLCRTEGRKFSDFLILARNTDAYNRIAPAIFESRGIDIFLDKRRSIISNPLVRLITTSLDIIANGYSYERIMTLARTGITTATDNEIDSFENYLLAVNPSHSMWNDAVWAYCPKGYDIDEINTTRGKITRFTECMKSELSGRRNAKEFCNAILNAMDLFELSDCISTLCESFSAQNMSYLAEEYKQVWNSVISIISQISVLMDDEYISRQDFYELFNNACSGINVGLTPQTQGSVVLSSIDTFRNSGTPVVIVLGMTDGVFPMPHTSEGIISDAERHELYNHGIQLAPGADFKQHEEQLLIYSVLSAPSEKLYLFCPLTNANGTPLAPSPILKRIKNKVFPDIEVYNPDLSGDILHGSEGKEAAFEILCTILAKASGNHTQLKPSEAKLYKLFANDKDYAEKLADIIYAMENHKPEKLSRASVDAIYGTPIRLSASKLEKYNACAYSFFLSYGLMASEREIAGIEARSTGTIQHEALYRYFSELKSANTDFSSITKEDCYKRMYSLVKDEAKKNSELLYESSSYYKYITTKMQGIASRTAWEVIKFYRSSKFRPIGFEIRIDTDGEIPQLEISNEDGKHIANLKGIIDKADMAEINGKNYIAITDYKSSSKPLNYNLVQAGVNIQPLLYSDIICKRMNASPAAMLYMQMTDPIVKLSANSGGISPSELEKEVNKKVAINGWMTDDAAVISDYSSGGENGEKYTLTPIPDSELRERINESNRKIQDSAMGIYNGNIDARPYCDKNYDACQYCLFSEHCHN